MRTEGFQFDRRSYPAALLADVRELLRDVDAEIAERQPVCRASGRCCRFEAYGHRLYVTAAELALFAARLDADGAMAADTLKADEQNARVSLPQFFAAAAPQGCPYQINGLCSARDARPLGCRIYFCDESAQEWQQDAYERFHARLTAQHQRYDVPYVYMEWRAALRSLLNPTAPPAAESF